MSEYICSATLVKGKENSVFKYLFESLEKINANLLNPYNNKVTAWNNDGDIIYISDISDFLKKADSAEVVGAQIWFGVGKDVKIFWENNGDKCVEFFLMLNAVEENIYVPLSALLIEMAMSRKNKYAEGMDIFKITRS